MEFPNLLLVISGPSGVGKGTLVSKYMERHPECYLSISLTTRAPRSYEVNGKDYYFITKGDFQKYIKEEKLLEWAEVFGELYGTPREPVEMALKSGRDVILEIDVQGGLKVKKSLPEAILIFVLPPSWKELRNRLSKRGTENSLSFLHRLEIAEIEFKYFKYYDYYLVNDTLDKAVTDLESIVSAEKHRISRTSYYLQKGGNQLVEP